MPDMRLVSYVAARIKAGQVVGMPTDTFCGLAADPLNLRAVDLIYEVKSRSRHKPLSLLIESVEQAEYLARPLPDIFYEITHKWWPGPLTIIVKASSRLPLKVTANTGNVALRLPAAKVPVEIIRAAGVPITATSANISGASECTTADGVRAQLGDRTPSAVVHSLAPLMLAEVAVMGTPAARMISTGTLAAGRRKATLPGLAVTFKGGREEAFTMMVSGPGHHLWVIS